MCKSLVKSSNSAYSEATIKVNKGFILQKKKKKFESISTEKSVFFMLKNDNSPENWYNIEKLTMFPNF